jgi:hypothetical protein
VFFTHLAETHPDLLADYRRRYRGRAYAPQADQRELATIVSRLVRQYGGTPAERSDPEHMSGPAAATEVQVRPAAVDQTQLSLL